ncbi:MAG: DUF2520 domain-containing protein [Planctomycetes bacterium]|nr:DUF2520 domain-containing protein [Planctomycetota bacterium]
MIVQQLHVHGPGKAGTGLARMLAARGTQVLSLSGGSGITGARARALLGAPWTAALPQLPEDAWLLLSVPDDVLAQVAANIAAGPLPRNATVVHLSAMHGRDVLAPLAARGLQTAAFHPLRSLANGDDAPMDLGGAMVAVDAAPECAAALDALATELGGHPLRVPAAQRTAYHLGAALAGNGVIALLEVAIQVWMRAGFSAADARRELASLASMALANAAVLGPVALTGPVQRGDVGTVQRHLAHMELHHGADAELLRTVYAALLRVAQQSGDARQLGAMQRLLGEEHA